MSNIELILGDCRDELKRLGDNSIDSIVTDPPAGIGFMGKEWDSNKGGRDAWIKWLKVVMVEAKRVLRPGGHALVWALPRTSHWTAFGLEDAGFEIRDIIHHVFSTGFPKSLDIGKAVDKLQGNERVGYVREDFVKRSNKLPQNKSQVICGEKGRYTKGSSQYEGMGTALKPAVEHWILCRKPISEKTIVKNVLKWGTGALNIDACRVGNETHIVKGGDEGTKKFFHGGFKEVNKEVMGRFPANLIHDGSDEVVKLFPNSKSGSVKGIYGHKEGFVNGEIKQNYNSSNGSAARFFYCPKPSRHERDAGVMDIEKIGDPEKGDGIKRICEFCKTPQLKAELCRCEKKSWILPKQRNNHPTVKSVKLMKFLITLITPPKGIVLDFFMGSGSTGVAAKELGFGFIGIEKEERYFEIAKKRIDFTMENLL